MRPTVKQRAEVLRVYDIWLKAYLNGDVLTFDFYFDDEYRFIGSTDNEDFLNSADTTKFFAATTCKGHINFISIENECLPTLSAGHSGAEFIIHLPLS
jgi:hypothetical protein